MKKYQITITVNADSEDDAEYMARDMLGSAYDSVLDWSVEPTKASRRPARKGLMTTKGR